MSLSGHIPTDSNMRTASKHKPWVWLAIIWCVGLLSAYLIWELDLYLGAYALVIILTVLLGYLGGRHRKWWMTVGGVAGLLISVYVSVFIFSVRGTGASQSVLPASRSEAIGMLIWYGVLLAIASLVHVVTETRRPPHPRFPPGHCQTCGYSLTGNVSGRCPECGKPAVAEPKVIRLENPGWVRLGAAGVTLVFSLMLAQYLSFTIAFGMGLEQAVRYGKVWLVVHLAIVFGLAYIPTRYIYFRTWWKLVRFDGECCPKCDHTLADGPNGRCSKCGARFSRADASG